MQDSGGGLSLGLQSSPAGMVADPRYKPWTGPGTQELTPDNHVKYTFPNPTTTEEITFGPSNFAWKAANGDIDLKGTLVSPGVNWYLPSP